MATQDANIRINIDASQSQKQTNELKKRMIELKTEMQNLAAAGKQNTAEFNKVQKEYASLVDLSGDLAQSTRALSSDYFQLQGTMEGLSLGVNVFSSLTQAAALFGDENEELAKTLNKLQGAMNLANSIMNISKLVNKDSALMIMLRTRYTDALNASVKEQVVTEEAATVTTKTLNTAETTATATTKGLSLSVKSLSAALKAVPLVGWIAAAVTALITLKSKLDAVQEEQRQAFIESQRQYTEAQDKINKSVADTTVKFDKLRYEYEKLGDTVEEKNKFIREHQGAFNDLGLSIKSVEDAEDAFVKNKTKFIDALMAKAQAAAAFDTATEKFVKIFENKKIIEENTKLAESLKTVWESQGVSQYEIENALKTYTNANAELQGEINATMSDIESLYELMVDDEPVKETGNTIKEVTALVEDFDAEMEQAMKGVDWRTEKQKSDEFWNSLFINMDEYQQKGEEIDRESIEWAERQDEILQKQIEAWKAKEKAKEESSKATLSAIMQATQIFSSFIEDNMDRELAAVEGNEEKEKAVRKKYARARFMSQIASIGVSTAQAIMEAWSSTAAIMFPGNLIAGGALTAMLAAAGIAQTAKAQQEMRNAMKYEKGGLIEGPRHSNGGVNINAEGGEFVMNRAATQAFLPMLEQMNNIGRPQAVQDVSIFTRDQVQNIVTETVKGITAIPVVVTQNDITQAQRNVNVIQSRSLF
jgi:hypothetical protein